MVLRPYQREALRSILTDYRAGIRRLLLVLPTSAGKTRVASRLPDLLKQQPGQQGFFLVNRDDLVWQALKAFRADNPNLRVGVEKADEHASPDSDIVIASVQTISRTDGIAPRFSRFKPERAAWVVCDECHNSTNKQWINALRYLRVFKGDPEADSSKLLLGISATPQRTDNVGLELIFDKITYEKPLKELMTEGPVINEQTYSWIAPLKAYRVQTKFDVSAARTRKGDFVEQDLSHALDNPDRNNLILEKYLEYGEGMPGACFTVDVKHAHHIAELFNLKGVPAAVVSGETKREERDRIYAAMYTGQVKIVCSCQAILEGWDVPVASVGLFARPSKSGLWFRQALGRILRRFPAPEAFASEPSPPWIKRTAIAIDFCDILGTHSVVTTPTLFGLRPEWDFGGHNVVEQAEQVQMVLKQYPTLGLDAKNIKELQSQVDEFDVFRPPMIRPDVRKWSRYCWLEVLDGVLQLCLKGRTLEIRTNALGHCEIYETRQGFRNQIAAIPGLKGALEFSDALVPRDERAIQSTKARWRAEEPTQPQCAMIYRNDERIRKRFEGVREFFQFCTAQHEAGDTSFSKGSLSQIISKFILVKSSTS